MFETINQIQGKVQFAMLLVLTLMVWFCVSFIKNKKWKLIISILFGIFITIQTYSIYFTNTFTSYEFYTFLKLKFEFKILHDGLRFAIISCILIAIFYFPNKINFNKKYNRIIKILKIFSISILAIIIVKNKQFISDISTIAYIFKKYDSKNFKKLLSENKIEKYITPDEIRSTAGKNIIIINLGSISNDLIEEENFKLIPNLVKLSKQWHYYEIKSTIGSNKPLASLYSYLTGFPAVFGEYDDRIFKQAYASNITSITHILNEVGYKNIFIGSNTDYNGLKELCNIMHFQKIIDYQNLGKPVQKNLNNVSDQIIFKKAKEEIIQSKENNNPFNLFISSRDTHFPNTHDESMEKFIPSELNNTDFSIAVLDYLVGDLISFLSDNNLLNNTSVYLMSDYIENDNPTYPSNLPLISNVTPRQIDTNNIIQLDIAKLILDGAGVNHNVKFLTDYIKEDKANYLLNNLNSLLRVNTIGIQNKFFKTLKTTTPSKNYKELITDTQRVIAHAGGMIDGYYYTDCKEALDLSYKKGIRLFELDILETSDGQYVAVHDWKDWKWHVNYNGSLPPSHKTFMEHKILQRYNPLDMSGINKWFKEHPDAILVTDKVNNPKKFTQQFFDKSRLMMELFDEKALEEGLQINILSAMPSETIIRNKTIEDVKKMAQKGVKHIIVSIDFLIQNKKLLLEFKKYNIKPYIFGLTNQTGLNENFVFKYAGDYLYGIYADDWNF